MEFTISGHNSLLGDLAKRIADVLVDVLAETGVRRIYGLPGDSLNEAQFRQLTFRYRLM
jgi:hypothetical protein